MTDSAEYKAWRVQPAPGEYAVIPRQTLGHLLDDFELYKLPLAPDYADSLLYWHGLLLPVVSLTALTDPSSSKPSLLGIVSFRAAGGQVYQGGILLYSPPELIDIPGQVAAWPEGSVPWSQLCESCVQIGDSALPILSTDKIYNLVSLRS